jgi:hypothetical protein
MRQGSLPFCAGLAAHTRRASWPTAYALLPECSLPRRMQVRGGLKPLLHVAGISW